MSSPAWAIPATSRHDTERNFSGVLAVVDVTEASGADIAPAKQKQLAKADKRPPGKNQNEKRFWRDLSYGLPSLPLTAVAAHPTDPDIIFVGADGFLFKTDDGGESWRAVLSFSAGVPDGGNPQTGADQTNLGTGPSRTFEISPDLPDGDFDAADLDDITDLADLESLPDGDFENTEVEAVFLFPRQSAGVRDIAIDGKGVVYVATPRGLYRSVDEGENWSNILLPGGAVTANVRAVAFDPRKPSVLYIGSASGLWISPDSGSTAWRAKGRVGQTPVLDIATSPLGAETVTVVGTEQGMFRTWKIGTEFQQVLVEGEGPFDPVISVAFDPRDAVTYAGTPNGLFAAERRSAVLEPRRIFSDVFATALLMDPRRLRSVAVGARDQGVVFAKAAGLERVAESEPLRVLQVTGLSWRAGENGALIAATERGIFIRDKSSGMTVSRDVMRELYDRWSREPTLQEVAEAAIDVAGVAPTHWDDWMARSRLSALLPEFRVAAIFFTGRFEFDFFVVDPEILFDPAVDTSDPDSLEQVVATDARISPSVRGVYYAGVARATWTPENLLYNQITSRILRTRPRHQKLEQRILNNVQTAFTARRRMMAQMASETMAVETNVAIARIIRLQELTGILDGASDGAFSRIAKDRGIDDPSAPLERE